MSGISDKALEMQRDGGRGEEERSQWWEAHGECILTAFLKKAASTCPQASCPGAENVFLPQLQLKKVLEEETRFGKNA